MKIQDIINEGMEFQACSIKVKDGQKMYSPHNMREVDSECYVCDGMAGKIEGYECRACKGTGKMKQWECDSPEMQVSNSNGFAIQQEILGVKPEYAGSIPNEDLPDLRRKLIRMLNVDKERESMHLDAEDKLGKVRVSQRGNVSTIHRGARVISPGRSDQQVLRYAQQLLKIVEYAMKNDLTVTWA